MIIDIRAPNIFAAKHIANSINIPLSQAFASRVAAICCEQLPTGVVAQSAEELEMALTYLKQLGNEKISFQIIWDSSFVSSARGSEFVFATMSTIAVDTLAKKIAEDDDGSLYLLDVRTAPEWDAGHIKEAHHIELNSLPTNLQKIPKELEICVICGSGYRSSTAASFLKRAEYKKVSNVQGGMTAWLPTGRTTL